MLWLIFVPDHLCGMLACAQWLSDWLSTSTSHQISLKVSGSQVTPHVAFNLFWTQRWGPLGCSSWCWNPIYLPEHCWWTICFASILQSWTHKCVPCPSKKYLKIICFSGSELCWPILRLNPCFGLHFESTRLNAFVSWLLTHIEGCLLLCIPNRTRNRSHSLFSQDLCPPKFRSPGFAFSACFFTARTSKCTPHQRHKCQFLVLPMAVETVIFQHKILDVARWSFCHKLCWVFYFGQKHSKFCSAAGVRGLSFINWWKETVSSEVTDLSEQVQKVTFFPHHFNNAPFQSPKSTIHHSLVKQTTNIYLFCCLRPFLSSNPNSFPSFTI